ncbi:MAG: HPr kinase/phosphorylase [Roseobacter sp.]
MHASCVAFCSSAVLITGASGTGKSSLALRLMALGCKLVSDDRTELRASDGMIEARAPEVIRGLIEARGLGLLHADTVRLAQVAFVITMDHEECDRLPPLRHMEILGRTLICVRNSQQCDFPAAVLQMLKQGRAEPDETT